MNTHVNKNKTVIEKLYTVSGDAESVQSDLNKFKQSHLVTKEFLNLQVMMLPQKVQGKIHQPGQTQLVPTQIVNAILVYEE